MIFRIAQHIFHSPEQKIQLGFRIAQHISIDQANIKDPQQVLITLSTGNLRYTLTAEFIIF